MARKKKKPIVTVVFSNGLELMGRLEQDLASSLRLSTPVTVSDMLPFTVTNKAANNDEFVFYKSNVITYYENDPKIEELFETVTDPNFIVTLREQFMATVEKIVQACKHTNQALQQKIEQQPVENVKQSEDPTTFVEPVDTGFVSNDQWLKEKITSMKDFKNKNK